MNFSFLLLLMKNLINKHVLLLDIINFVWMLNC